MKNLKKLAFILSGVMLTVLLGGCFSNKSDSSSDNSTSVDSVVLKVGMTTDEGGIGDKSFNHAANMGLLKAKEDLNIGLQVLEPKQDSEFEAYTSRLAQDNDLVVGVGYKLKPAIDKVSSDIPDKNFILVDEVLDKPNVLNLNFKEEEGSFLVGVIAGLMTKTNKVAFIGGTESAVVDRFESGYIAGVMSVNKEAGEALLNGEMVRYAGSFSDVAKGYELANSLYKSGADIIFHAAGGVGIGMINAAVENGKYAIGVDSDQAIIMPEAAGNILTSMVKNLDSAIYNEVDGIIKSGFKAGTRKLGLKENGVSIAETSSKNVPKEVLDKVEEFKIKIIDGEIVVPSTPDELKEFQVIS